jgi:hypothetical protein
MLEARLENVVREECWRCRGFGVVRNPAITRLVLCEVCVGKGWVPRLKKARKKPAKESVKKPVAKRSAKKQSAKKTTKKKASS